MRNLPLFTFGEDRIEVTHSYTYLGIKLYCTGSFKLAKDELLAQSTRAMYAVINQGRKLCLPIDIQIELFQSMVMSIMLYGVEIWGFESLEWLERLYLKFLKILLNVKMSTPSVMVYGELGCFIEIYAKSRIINFWSRLLCGSPEKLSFIMYKTMYESYTEGT